MASPDIASYFKTGKSMTGEQTTQRDDPHYALNAKSVDSQTDSFMESPGRQPISKIYPATHTRQSDQPMDLSKEIDKSNDNSHKAGNVNIDICSRTPSSEESPRNPNLDMSVDKPHRNASSDFVIYRPSKAVPILQGRLAKTPPPCESKWTVPACWPPSETAKAAKPYESEPFPSKTIPLHLQIQAYALRWGYWASKIADNERRQEVLKCVTDQMRQAWEMAIKEGYYQMSNNTVNASNSGDVASPANGKRSRKRALSVSKQPAGFTSEGKDPYAVTLGELQQNGVTMDMIKKRIENRNLVDAELLMDKVLTSLDRDINFKDWSISAFSPQVRGRNLLMYCLYVVQQSRSEIEKLQWLQKKFFRDSQKRNTQARMDNHYERVNQHLALAAELNTRQSDSSMESEEVTSVAAESFHGESQQLAETHHDVQSKPTNTDDVAHQASPPMSDRAAKNVLIELAEAILSARDQHSLFAAFTSYGLSKDDFKADTGMDVGRDETLLAVKRLLGEIFDQILRIDTMQNNSSQQQDPKEKIRIGHAVQLTKQQIAQSMQKLRTVLDQACHDGHEHEGFRKLIPFIGRVEHPSALDKLPYPTPAVGEQPAPPGSTLWNAAKRHRLDDDHNTQLSNKKPKTENVADTIVDGTKVSSNIELATGVKSNITKDSSTVHSELDRAHKASSSDSKWHNQSEEAEKQAYINQVWLPIVNQMLTQSGLPQYQGSLSKWNAIKEVLIGLGYDSDVRNAYLREFKKGFENWCDEHDLGVSGANVAPTVKLLVKDDSNQQPQAQVPSSRMSSSTNNDENKVSHSNTKPAIDGADFKTPVTDEEALNRPRHSLIVKLKLTDVQDFGEYQSHLLQDAPKHGFTFRFLPCATMDQRIRLDELIGDYLNQAVKPTRPYGQYVQFVDPEDPSGDEVAHGFWNRRDGNRPERSEWFYAGMEKPEDWNESEISDTEVEYATGDFNVHATKKAPKMASNQRQPDASGRSINTKRQSGTQGRMAGHIPAPTPPSKIKIKTRSAIAKKPQRPRHIILDEDDVSDPDYDPSD